MPNWRTAGGRAIRNRWNAVSAMRIAISVVLNAPMQLAVLPTAQLACLLVLVSYRPLAVPRIFPREVIVRGSSRHRSNTGSRGGLGEPDPHPSS